MSGCSRTDAVTCRSGSICRVSVQEGVVTYCRGMLFICVRKLQCSSVCPVNVSLSPAVETDSYLKINFLNFVSFAC